MQTPPPQAAYVFDVDGVLTNPETKRFELASILDELLKRLNLQLPITFNTGRSLVFMDPILKHLENHVVAKSLLRNVIAVGEKGATWVTYDELGVRQEVVDTTVSVPTQLQQQIKEIIEVSYAETMFLDMTKKTMMSIELESQDHLAVTKKSFADFQKAQQQLTNELRQLLVENGLENTLKVDPTRIATDVESVLVGKALGARRIFTLLQERNIVPSHYFSFGDSPSDLHMHREFQRLGCRSTFVYVGEATDLEGVEDGVILTSQQVDRGTLEFLQAEELPSRD